MSIMQRLTLIGFYNYDATLFDGLELPEGYDKELFINSLLLEHGEKLVLYSNPDFMKNAIEVWGRKWSLELGRIYEALTAEYNPLHNYDRYEEYKDTIKGEAHSGRKTTDSPNFSVVNDTNEDATTESLISADNSGSYQPQNKTIENGGKSTTSTSGKTSDVDETINNNDERTIDHTAHLYGNIGVSESTTMIENTVSMRRNYNLYEAATRLFANELLISIY